LKRGRLPVDDVVRIAHQIAEGLEAAHERGVIHRDLKPANVRVAGDGTVKILDFGLAKERVAEESMVADPSLSPTMTWAGSVAGVLLGTAAYMSPEQARGQEVDERSDIWSFGCVLWECLTGRRLFGGATASDSIAAILHTEPDGPTPATPPHGRRPDRVGGLGPLSASLQGLHPRLQDRCCGVGGRPDRGSDRRPADLQAAGWRSVGTTGR
jgi:serine/threonine protein kinase